MFSRQRFPAHRLLSLSKNESFVFNSVDLIRIKAKLTNSSLQNVFLTLYCGDVCIVLINLWKEERQAKKINHERKGQSEPFTCFTTSFFSWKKCLPPEVTKAKSIEIWGNRILRIKIYFLQNKFILKEGKFPFTLFVQLQKQKNDTCLSEPGKFICYTPNGYTFHTRQYCSARLALSRVSGVRKRLVMSRNNSSFKSRKILGL